MIFIKKKLVNFYCQELLFKCSSKKWSQTEVLTKTEMFIDAFPKSEEGGLNLEKAETKN